MVEREGGREETALTYILSISRVKVRADHLSTKVRLLDNQSHM